MRVLLRLASLAISGELARTLISILGTQPSIHYKRQYLHGAAVISLVFILGNPSLL